MEILVFLIIFFNLVLFLWAFGFFKLLRLKQKHQLRSKVQRQSPPKLPASQVRDKIISQQTKPTSPVSQIRDQAISVSSRSVVAPRQPPVFKKLRTQLARNKHQLNIQRGDRLLEQLRSKATEVKLPMVIAMLRQMNPYAFEELLLTCCKDQGWQIQRNFRYSGDGGVDGRVVIAGKLYLIQAKRYTGHIKLEHIRNFHNAIQEEGATSGFFVHTGKTGPLSKELLRQCQINLLSGQQLVDFVLGKQLKILGVTIPFSLETGSN
jgi:restriction system protein